MRRAALLLSAATALACTDGHSRGSSCDERALDAALTQFEADPGADDAPLELINAMSRACPDYPGPLFEELKDYVENESGRSRALGRSLPYDLARRMACADVEGWIELDYRASDNRAQEVYEVCEFERLGLHEPGEPFLSEDFPAIVTQRWMINHRVDPALARRFNRGLMLASAPAPLSRRRCLAHPDSPACATLMRAYGRGLPTSSAPIPVELSIEPETMVFRAPTWAGIDARDGLDDLQGTIAAHIGDREAHGLLVYADRQTRWGQLIELLRSTQTQAEVGLSLVAERGDSLARLPVVPAPTWRGGRRLGYDWLEEFERHARTPVFVVEADGVRVPGDGQLVPIDDSDRLEAIARELVRSSPKHSVIVRASADVELQTVVSVFDALRGHDCSYALPSAELIYEGCFVWQPIIDLDPPTQRRPGDWSRLQLSLAPDEPSSPLPNERERPASRSQLRARVQQALAPIQACVIESEAMRWLMPAHLTLIFGLTDRDELGVGVGVFAADGPWFPSNCITAALEVPGISRPARAVDTAFAEIELRVELPP